MIQAGKQPANDAEQPNYTMARESAPQICNYEDSAYRTEFWGQGRAYEDAAERAALRHLLPSRGKRLIDIGGGYGRLVPLYDDYDEVVLFDYAMSQLRQGQELWGSAGPEGRPRYVYVAGDFYNLPFAPNAFDTVVMVRALHHAADAPSVLRGVSEILVPGGIFVLEFANKRNLKAILRYLLRRQDWSPFTPEPVEFVSLNFDFHPRWIAEHLSREGLIIQERRAVSSFRLGLLKRMVPTALLVALDRLLQPTGELLPFSPSVFVRCEASAAPSELPQARLFRCTVCGSTDLEEEAKRLACHACGTSFPVESGVYNFKPLQDE
jgi:ubiquinone/menaquinone biosynthesis C-methylase UbiE